MSGTATADDPGEAVPFASLRPAMADRMLRDMPKLTPASLISAKDVARYRGLLIEELLQSEQREITPVEREVIESLARRQTVSDNVEQEMEEQRTFGEAAADSVAEFGGSWSFIILFTVVLVVWMAVNVAMASHAFDPYPFILLNLVLSCIAAAQAPVIMMSQRRTEAKDRARSLNDYQVNLKAELEIRHLHEKIDHLMSQQMQRLTELHRLQTEMMRDIAGRI